MAITVQDVLMVCPELAAFASTAPAWTVATAYALGQRVSNARNLYQAAAAGTSAGSGTGPTGTGTVVDGTVSWQWVSLYGPDVIAANITAAEAMVDAETWGSLYNYGLALMAAHLTLMSQPQLGGLVAGGGVVQSVSIGSMSKTFATTGSTASSGPNSTTRPGSLYDSILTRLGPSFLYL